MSDPEAWARAVKDILSWSGPMLPVKLGWVILAIMTVLSVGWLIGKWRGK